MTPTDKARLLAIFDGLSLRPLARGVSDAVFIGPNLFAHDAPMAAASFVNEDIKAFARRALESVCDADMEAMS